jgi:predicted dehydrogenase
MFPMPAPLRFGILGYAHIAKVHLIPAMLEAKNAIPYAIASTNPEKLKQAQAEFAFQKALTVKMVTACFLKPFQIF